MNKKSIGFIMNKILLILLAIFLIIICVSPLFFIFLNAPKTREEYSESRFDVPDNFINLFNNVRVLIDKYGIMKQLLNTLAVVAIGVFLSVLFSATAGYAFSKLKFLSKGFLYWSIIGLLAVPYQVIVIPLYVMFSKIGLVNNLFGVALIHSTFAFAFGTFFMTSFYNGIPNEILNSAKVDGANSFQIFYKIIIPLGKPALITLAVINFFSFWNELFISLIFLQEKSTRVITPSLTLLQQAARSGKLTNWPLTFSGMLISIIIPLLVFIIFQNRLAYGITLGAIKE